MHAAGHYDESIGTFEMMLLKISQSPDPKIRGMCVDIVLSLLIDLGL